TLEMARFGQRHGLHTSPTVASTHSPSFEQLLEYFFPSRGCAFCPFCGSLQDVFGDSFVTTSVRGGRPLG
ncbi:hypothetical protein, partial [Salmonella enterica]|uniref:hypothetical protein n=1 Tax=Salmonella enterica TaxID=28901 RepID=UPI0019D4FC88